MLSKEDFSKIIKSFGLVFGDIGTSPIYTVTVIFLILEPTLTNVMGITSLIFWTLMILVTIEYSWLAMSLGRMGEGGTIVLKKILVTFLKSGRKVAFVTILSIIGVSLLIGDGVITPAISILSAVEGIRLIPGYETISQNILVIIAGVIALGLFSFQRKGTDTVTKAFGPIMAIWFIALAISGLYSIIQFPFVIQSINPWHAVSFLGHHGIASFFILSEVMLCATGGEALYADMGHLGRAPIIRGWAIVFFALILNYLGQGAYIALHPDAKNILFEMVKTNFSFLYVPFLVLSILATVIASQAMISAMFSIVYQGITTRIMPMFKVDYTSAELRTQIYIATVNWFLFIFVILVFIVFRESSNLAAAYGLAVSGTITITGIMMTWIFSLKKKYVQTAIVAIVTVVDIVFLAANMLKIPHGGYWSLIIASIPFIMILIYTNGYKRLFKSLKPLFIKEFLEKYNDLYSNNAKIKGTALYFIRDVKVIPPYITNTLFENNILYEDNIFISINILNKPFGCKIFFKDEIAPGLRTFEIQVGYMEFIDIEKVLKMAGIDEKVIFYGVEDILTDNPLWKVFAFIKKITPSFVQFYFLPPNKLHGVITRVVM